METNILINKPSPKFQDVSIAPMHTAEHLLNATMVKTFGCPRSRNAHIEKKKANVITNFRLAQRRSKFMPLKKSK